MKFFETNLMSIFFIVLEEGGGEQPVVEDGTIALASISKGESLVTFQISLFLLIDTGEY